MLKNWVSFYKKIAAGMSNQPIFVNLCTAPATFVFIIQTIYCRSTKFQWTEIYLLIWGLVCSEIDQIRHSLSALKVSQPYKESKTMLCIYDALQFQLACNLFALCSRWWFYDHHPIYLLGFQMSLNMYRKRCRKLAEHISHLTTK